MKAASKPTDEGEAARMDRRWTAARDGWSSSSKQEDDDEEAEVNGPFGRRLKDIRRGRKDESKVRKILVSSKTNERSRSSNNNGNMNSKINNEGAGMKMMMMKVLVR